MRACIRIEFAEESGAVFFCRLCKLRDEGLDQVTAGAAEGFRTAEICCVRLYEIRVEVVLADEKAELISEPGLAVPGTVGGMGSV